MSAVLSAEPSTKLLDVQAVAEILGCSTRHVYGSESSTTRHPSMQPSANICGATFGGCGSTRRLTRPTCAMRRVKRGDYRRLAHSAQGIESDFMFRRVLPRIMELRPDLFVATIHDSILTTADNAEFVRGVMLGQFAALGLSPQVKVEPCAAIPCLEETTC
jgi:hypothetical protein